MSDYESQILGSAPSWDNDQDPLEYVEKQLHKMKKKKKGKGRKKLKKRVRALEQELQQYKKLEKKRRKKNKGKKLKKRAREWDYQRPWWQDAVTASLPQALKLVDTCMSRQPSKREPPLALPEHRD